MMHPTISYTPAAPLALRAAGQLFLAIVLVMAGAWAQASADTIDVGPSVQATGTQTEHMTIIVKRPRDGQVWISNPARAQQRFSPASTSKIPHTLIALERGLARADTVFQWDGVLRSVRAWNQDQTLATAFQRSAVWVYQEIARTAGRDAMSDGLARFDYGNGNVGGGDDLATYWLDGTLRISAAEQIEFLTKLANERLALSRDTYAAAKEMMISDEGANWVMRSKTGWFYSKDAMDIGWFVGWLACANDMYVFAMNLDMPDTRSLAKRQAVTYAVLTDIGAFDCD